MSAPKPPIAGMLREDFIEFLTSTLIPDLRVSGNQATADDFDMAVRFLLADERVFDALSVRHLNRLTECWPETRWQPSNESE